MDSFYIFRAPGEKSFVGGRGYAVNELTAGFIISSFRNDADALQTIVSTSDFSLSDLREIQDKVLSDPAYDLNLLYPFPLASSSKEEHIERLERVISNLNREEKTVSCRIIKGIGEVNLTETLLLLDSAFPNAMVFCFYTPKSGIWIGASPEKLVSIRGKEVQTVALAGTRVTGTKEEWDSKNIVEQRLVTDYIAGILKDYDIDYSYNPSPETQPAGPIEHLCTRFQGTLPEKFALPTLQSFLFSLSPTPALCGFPKEKSMAIIEATEDFDRGYYGGFFGELKENGDCSLYVLLRSVRVEKKSWCMFAGGGITKDSSPEKEWIETENKGRSIIEKLIFVK